MRATHSVLVVYDDSLTVPPEVAAVTGVQRFGDMLRRRERLSTTVRSLSEQAGLGGMLHARSAVDLAGVGDSARRYPEDMLYLLLPSNLAPTAERDDAVLFLKKLRYLTEPVGIARGEDATGAYLVDREGLLAYIAESEIALGDPQRHLRELGSRLPPVEDALGLADLRELGATLEFLSGSFSARHFNQVAHDRYTVVKHSHDRDKIRREHAFFGFLPEAMQPYFLQPFDYREDASGASYRTRRLFVPDLAVQWVHGALTAAQFEQLLGHLFHFLDLRPRRDVGRDAVREVATALYVGKVRERLDQLAALPAGRRADAALRAGGVDGGVEALVEAYERAYEQRARRRRDRELAVSHGDLCFSNVLYSPSTQTFQLIDPRGADSEDETYSDPYYDVAKLSHSVLGGYDFIVAGLFDLVHRDDLALALRIDAPPAEPLRRQFARTVERHGFDLGLVRLCEASLFLSMLPLHADAPKRLVAFALRARDILAELGA
jgi:hypothetical protein